jgi:5'-methylthioadenosine phosphorylase
MHALVELGCDRVLALSSVGSLRPSLGVGTVVVPDDFVALSQEPHTIFDDGRGHRVPGFDPAWRARIVRAVHAAGPRHLRDGGVYWQVAGPRFETAAEVRYVATFADVVGMTVGTECVAAGEHGLAYAAVCIVDNLANGLAPAPLTVEEFEAGTAANQAWLVPALDPIVAALAP